MKQTAVGLLLATFAGAAAAGDLSEPRYYESNDYSAQLVYRVQFGGQQAQSQSLGLRFDSVRAEAAGAPSLFHVRFGAQGMDKLAVNGVDLRGVMLAARQDSGGGFFANMTTLDWVGLGVTVVGAIVVSADLASDDGPSTVPTGTGTGGT